MQQQGTNEFLIELIDQLCSETRSPGHKANTWDIDTRKWPDEKIAREFKARFRCINNSTIGDLFAFQTRSMNMCSHCGEAARNFDVQMSLELPIPLGAPPGSVATLRDCLIQYTKPEYTADNSREVFFRCETCKQTRGSTHQTKLYTLPKILLVTLKRFRQSMAGNFSDKINVLVVYPLELDLAQFMLPEARPRNGSGNSTRYRLVGHVSHQGNTHGGHYTATTRDPGDGKWFFASDERLNESSGAQADFTCSYILFNVRE